VHRLPAYAQETGNLPPRKAGRVRALNVTSFEGVEMRPEGDNSSEALLWIAETSRLPGEVNSPARHP
jgi:hypothetical protein